MHLEGKHRHLVGTGLLKSSQRDWLTKDTIQRRQRCYLALEKKKKKKAVRMLDADEHTIPIMNIFFKFLILQTSGSVNKRK